MNRSDHLWTPKQAALIFANATDLRADKHGTLTVYVGKLRGREFVAAFTDSSVSGGSYGYVECQALTNVLQKTIHTQAVILLFIDSGGARVTEGLKAVGAFRSLFKVFLTAREENVPIYAILGRNCFGGASMLASCCHKVYGNKNTRFGMSGPKIIENVNPSARFKSVKDSDVTNLLGAESRAVCNVIDQVVEGSEAVYQELVEHIVGIQDISQVDIGLRHDALKKRLLAFDLLKNFSNQNAPPNLASGTPVGAETLWRLSDYLLNQKIGGEINIDLNTSGHSAEIVDERVVLTEYLVHASACMSHRIKNGKPIRVRISGNAAGGILLALAAPTDSVTASPDSVIQVLPCGALQSIRLPNTKKETLSSALKYRVVDKISGS